MSILNLGSILSHEDRKFLVKTVEEWGGSIRLRSMSAADGLKFGTYFTKYEGKNSNAFMLRLSLVDENGVPLIATTRECAEVASDAAHIKECAPCQAFADLTEKKSMVVINDLADACRTLNRMPGLPKVDEKTSEGEQAKNDSSEAVTAASPSA